MGRQLKLNLFIYPGGHHEAAWRHPKSHTDRLLDIRFYQELAQRAEAAKLDAVFYADGPALENNVQYASGSGSSRSPGCPRLPSPQSGSA